MFSWSRLEERQYFENKRGSNHRVRQKFLQFKKFHKVFFVVVIWNFYLL